MKARMVVCLLLSLLTALLLQRPLLCRAISSRRCPTWPLPASQRTGPRLMSRSRTSGPIPRMPAPCAYTVGMGLARALFWVSRSASSPLLSLPATLAFVPSFAFFLKKKFLPSLWGRRGDLC